MKIAYGSDIHNEFGFYEIENKENADVLILAGDICVVQSFYQTCCEEFFDKCADEFEHVIYVTGNHEYYRGDIKKSFSKLKEFLSKRKNIHLLENELIDIDQYRFIGSTLWTDMNNRDPITKNEVLMGMNDFSLISYNSRKFLPNDAISLHEKSIDFISNSLNDDTKYNIVITHHAPSQKSISHCYSDDYHMNGAYRTNLDDIISNKNILAWIHGHTHHNVDYMIGNTRILSNQRGYIGIQDMADDFDLAYLTLQEIE